MGAETLVRHSFVSVEFTPPRLVMVRIRLPMTLDDARTTAQSIMVGCKRCNGVKALMCADVRTRVQFSPELLAFFSRALQQDNPLVERGVWIARKGVEGLALYNVAREASDANTRRIVSADIPVLLQFMEGVATAPELASIAAFFNHDPDTL